MKRVLAATTVFGLVLLGGCAPKQEPFGMPPPGAPEQQMGAYPGSPPPPMAEYQGAPPQPMGGYPGASQPMGAYPGAPQPMGGYPGAPPGMPAAGPSPQVVELVAERVIAHYQTSSCQTLAQERRHPNAQRAEMVQRAAQVLRDDPQVRMEFLNRVAAPVANKLFECGLIP